MVGWYIVRPPQRYVPHHTLVAALAHETPHRRRRQSLRELFRRIGETLGNVRNLNVYQTLCRGHLQPLRRRQAVRRDADPAGRPPQHDRPLYIFRSRNLPQNRAVKIGNHHFRSLNHNSSCWCYTLADDYSVVSLTLLYTACELKVVRRLSNAQDWWQRSWCAIWVNNQPKMHTRSFAGLRTHRTSDFESGFTMSALRVASSYPSQQGADIHAIKLQMQLHRV